MPIGSQRVIQTLQIAPELPFVREVVGFEDRPVQQRQMQMVIIVSHVWRKEERRGRRGEVW